MSALTRDQYMKALRASEHVQNPTIEQMLAICPHLTKDQVVDGLMGEKGGYIALPPVIIKYGFRSASYYPGSKNKGPDPSFGAGLSHRTPSSYADGESHGDAFGEYRFMAEAMAYAEEHWPESLRLDDWVNFQEVYLDDPTDQDVHGNPETKAVVYVCLNRDWDEIRGDRTKTAVQVWDDAISFATLDSLEGSELQGGRGGGTEFVCAHCGGGLGLSICYECKNRFHDDQYRKGTCISLPPKLIKLLRESGHEFALDPERLLKVPV